MARLCESEVCCSRRGIDFTMEASACEDVRHAGVSLWAGSRIRNHSKNQQSQDPKMHLCAWCFGCQILVSLWQGSSTVDKATQIGWT